MLEARRAGRRDRPTTIRLRVTLRITRARYLILGVALLFLTGMPGSLSAAPPVGEPADTVSRYQLGHGWFTRDKSYHLGVSALGAAAVYATGRELGLGRWPSIVGASLVMGTVGFLREAYAHDQPDRLSWRSFSRKDMAWNGVGIALGISLTDLLGGKRWAGAPVGDAAIMEPVPPGGSLAP